MTASLETLSAQPENPTPIKIRFSTIEACRLCGSRNIEILLKFDSMPILAEPVKASVTVPCAPLTVCVCATCRYVFLEEVIDDSIYRDYIYTPQTSDDVVAYLQTFVSNTVNTLNLKSGMRGLEIGSGDGSLCREFVMTGIHFTGVEPSTILSTLSRDSNHVETHNSFMNAKLAETLGSTFDLVVVRHVLEHIHDFSSFIGAIDRCLKPGGTLVVEVPYLGDIVSQKQFFSFFFEHLSYFSVTSLSDLLQKFGFYINHTEFVHPEGGSVLIHAIRQRGLGPHERPDFSTESLRSLGQALFSCRRKFESIVTEHGPIAAYGAGQRGVTLLNLMGASDSNVVAVFDENPAYHGLLTPQSGILVQSPEMMTKDYVKGKVLILASSYDQQIRNKYLHMTDRFISLSEIT